MILEGIVTTIATTGAVNIAPMGPLVDADMQRLVLRPFKTSQTYQNLRAHGEGVLHVVDDALMLAQAAVGQLAPPPSLMPCRVVRGQVLCDSCRFYEFRVSAIDDRDDRVRIDVDVVHRETLREFFGFNRAKHAIVEAAILATRTHLIPIAQIDEEYQKLAIIVHKTGGPRERQAMEFLQRYVTDTAAAPGGASMKPGAPFHSTHQQGPRE